MCFLLFLFMIQLYSDITSGQLDVSFDKADENPFCYLLLSGYSAMHPPSDVAKLFRIHLNVFPLKLDEVGTFPSMQVFSFDYDPSTSRYYFAARKHNSFRESSSSVFVTHKLGGSLKKLKPFYSVDHVDVKALILDEEGRLYIKDNDITRIGLDKNGPKAGVRVADIENSSLILDLLASEGFVFMSTSSEDKTGYSIQQYVFQAFIKRQLTTEVMGHFCGMSLNPGKRKSDKFDLYYCSQNDFGWTSLIKIYQKRHDWKDDIIEHTLFQKEFPTYLGHKAVDLVSTVNFLYMVVSTSAKIPSSEVWKMSKIAPEKYIRLVLPIKTDLTSKIRFVTPKSSCNNDELRCSDVLPNIILEPSCSGSTGKSCNYSCKASRKTGVFEKLRCNKGIWEGNVSHGCTHLCAENITGIALDVTCTRESGTECNYTCDTGRPTKALTCRDGHWSDTDNLCTVLCEKEIPRVVIEPNCTRLPGALCNYSCAEGCRKVDPMLVCGFGFWKNPIQDMCVKLCGANIPHGKWDTVCSRQTGDYCAVTCKEGWTPRMGKVGCRDGYWENPVQTLCSEDFSDSDLLQSLWFGIALLGIVVFVVILSVIMVLWRKQKNVELQLIELEEREALEKSLLKSEHEELICNQEFNILSQNTIKIEEDAMNRDKCTKVIEPACQFQSKDKSKETQKTTILAKSLTKATGDVDQVKGRDETGMKKYDQENAAMDKCKRNDDKPIIDTESRPEYEEHCSRPKDEDHCIASEYNRMLKNISGATKTKQVMRIKKAYTQYQQFCDQNKGKLPNIDNEPIFEAINTMLTMTKHMDLASQAANHVLEVLVMMTADLSHGDNHGDDVAAHASEAKNKVNGLQSVATIQKELLSIDRKIMSEIRQYPQPHHRVHEVMIASLLLLGHEERDTRKWNQCQKLCMPLPEKDYEGLYSVLKHFKLASVHPEIAMRVKEILGSYTQAQVSRACFAVGVFYKWAMAVCDECLASCEDLPKPAVGERQAEILGLGKDTVSHSRHQSVANIKQAKRYSKVET